MAASGNIHPGRVSMFEPVHGSAPDIAGQGIANPTGALRSVALLLRHAADEEGLATQVERAVDAALQSAPTRDLGGTATTAEFTDTVVGLLELP
jgi:3-isopropylmalate dehydrogenase